MPIRYRWSGAELPITPPPAVFDESVWQVRVVQEVGAPPAQPWVFGAGAEWMPSVTLEDTGIIVTVPVPEQQYIAPRWATDELGFTVAWMVEDDNGWRPWLVPKDNIPDVVMLLQPWTWDRAAAFPGGSPPPPPVTGDGRRRRVVAVLEGHVFRHHGG
jgi:hypothetical protein